MPDAIHLAPDVTVDPDALRFSFTRSRGPGGQAVNKVATRAELRVAVEAIDGLKAGGRRRLRRLAGRRLTNDDEILIAADEHRSQRRNRAACLERLAELVLEAATPPRPRKPTRPSRGSVERRLQSKRETAEKKRRRREPPKE